MSVELRKFPYPYRAGLAICSDVDNTPDADTYFGMLDYLNGAGDTPLGEGLGLEVGNSFWFFNGTSQPQVTYFDAAGNETNFAAPCRDLWQSGHIDTCHSYGNFDTGGFARQHAERAINELQAHGANITVWVNHGTDRNSQNVGPYAPFEGGQRGSPAYHIDLTLAAGIRYFWVERLTHILGQDSRRRAGITAKRYLQEIVRRVKYRSIDRAFYDFQNRLILPATLQDGTLIWDFQRWVSAWGGLSELDVADLGVQLHPKNISALLKNEGFLIIYTHMTENLSLDRGFPAGVEAGLLHIKKLYDEGDLLVATTGRLLRYSETSKFVDFSVTATGGLTRIVIDPALKTPIGKSSLQGSDLDGLTFYVDDPHKARVIFNGDTVDTQVNSPDRTGRPSLSIPWRKLEYPRG